MPPASLRSAKCVKREKKDETSLLNQAERNAHLLLTRLGACCLHQTCFQRAERRLIAPAGGLSFVYNCIINGSHGTPPDSFVKKIIYIFMISFNLLCSCYIVVAVNHPVISYSSFRFDPNLSKGCFFFPGLTF